jgi:hypothetical protein
MILMEAWLTSSMSLKLITALFVMVLVFNRSMSGRKLWMLVVTAFTAALVMRIRPDGPTALLTAGSGAALSLILTLPLYKFKRATGEDVITSIVVGSMIGPVAYAAAYTIALALLAVQLVSRAETSLCFDRFYTSGSSSGTNLIMRDEKSALAEIEAKKILNRECEEYRELDIDNIKVRDAFDLWRNKLMPWCDKMAIAVIAVMMAGLV